MHRVMRKNLNDGSVKSLYETTDLDDAYAHLEKNFHTVHVANGEPVEEFYVEEEKAKKEAAK